MKKYRFIINEVNYNEFEILKKKKFKTNYKIIHYFFFKFIEYNNKINLSFQNFDLIPIFILKMIPSFRWISISTFNIT